MSHEETLYKLNHVFLPPKLPQTSDAESGYDKALLRTVVGCLSSFKNYVGDMHCSVVDSAMVAMQLADDIHEERDRALVVSEKCLKSAFFRLSTTRGEQQTCCGDTHTDKWPASPVLVHIGAQNAGLMVSKQKQHVIFEVFEVSPRSEDVMTTTGRLHRSFPASAIAIELSLFELPDFQAAIASAVSNMSSQAVPGTQPRVKKARQMHVESRDTTHPMMVTEFLMTVLVAHGGTTANTTTIEKHTREEVLYQDTTLPWCRSPLWLFVRVTLQIIFSRLSLDHTDSRDLYKEFMVFLMANIARECHIYPIESDYLSVVSAKLNRRLLKLCDTSEELRQFVHSSMSSTNRVLEKRWLKIQKQNSGHLPLSALETLDFVADSEIEIPLLDEFIVGLSTRQELGGQNMFAPSHPLAHFRDDQLPTLPTTSTEEQEAGNLMALEIWVGRSLRLWIGTHKQQSDTSGRLRFLIEDYHSKALNVYGRNPELVSVMILTILELWVACDISTLEICPMLREYDPGLSIELLQNLILPSKSQLQRLNLVERYIMHRRRHSAIASRFVFGEFGSPLSFAVKYFQQSPPHQELLENIETRAHLQRHQKCEEFRRQKVHFKNLMDQQEELDCEETTVYDEYWDRTETVHKSSCQKCRLKTEAEELTILIDEWPLPSNALQAKSTVFELLIPDSFGHWRDTTAFVLLNVLMMKYASNKLPNYKHTLRQYAGLSAYMTSFSAAQRVELLSETKPHMVTHRKILRISTSCESDVCLNSGLQYQYFDNITGSFTCDFDQTLQIPNLCTYQVPGSSPLQQFLFRPADSPSGPSPNTIPASLCNCPDNMSLEEYKALCALPFGNRTQWQNILVQLNAPAVDFKKIETELFLLQCIGQVGPRQEGTVLRCNHCILDDSRFAESLIDSVNQVSHRLKQNWQAASAFGVFTSLVTHLLSISSHSRVRQKCLDFLEFARAVTLEWTLQLKDRVQESMDKVTRDGFRAKVADVALVCVGTFDVDYEVLVELLKSAETASVFLQCCIIIQESELLIQKGESEHSTSLRCRRWKRLCQTACPVLTMQILNLSNTALDNAIAMSWQAYEGHGHWQKYSVDHGNWLVKDTAPRDSDRSAQVQFNLQTGELLVNGVPLDRLPTKYERHPMYRQLFGQSVIEVMPSHLPGMQFSSKKKYAGYILHFGLDNPSDQQPGLLIRAMKGSDIFELISPDVFQIQLPAPLARDHIQWYDVANNQVDFRPQDEPWTQSRSSWQLHASTAGGKWRLESDGQSIIATTSRTGKALANVFSSVEAAAWIQAALNPTLGDIEIALPRLQLSFKLGKAKSNIMSKEFQGLEVDENQNLGTLIGLRNKILLRKNISVERLLLVPGGQVHFHRSDGHTQVSIDSETVTRTHVYRVDDRLGRLIDNGSAQDKIFMAYLHALTSFCLPDPLTGKTGTEQALSILDSAAVRSFDRWSRESFDLLLKLARLTPGRKYYPEHKRVMQTVHWLPQLGFLAQHNGFFTLVQAIFNRTVRSRFFYPESWIKPPLLTHVDSTLLRRDDIRSATFRLSCYGAELHSSQHDGTYASRDRWQESRRVRDVLGIASTVYRESMGPHFTLPQDLKSHLWHLLSGSDIVQGRNHQIPDGRLSYDAQWLTDESFVFENWVVLHRLLSDGLSLVGKFHFALWLSAMAFGQEVDKAILYIVAGFAICPELRRLHLPSASSFHLKNGVIPKAHEISQALLSASKPLRECPENSLPRLQGEAKGIYQRRQTGQFKQHRSAAIESLAEAMRVQWPCEVLKVQADDNPSRRWHVYIDMSHAMDLVNSKFKSWFANRCFQQYLERISNATPRQETHLSIAALSLSMKPGTRVRQRRTFICSKDVFSHRAPRILEVTCSVAGRLLTQCRSAVRPGLRLSGLVAQLDRRSSSTFERKYVEQLTQSLEALENYRHGFIQQRLLQEDVVLVLNQHHGDCTRRVNEIYRTIVEAAYCTLLENTESFLPDHIAVPNLYQWPRIRPAFFLQQLCAKRWVTLSPDWKRCIVQYGVALTHLQQAERLLSLTANLSKLTQELENIGHTNWHPMQDPESLLIELESGFMVREVQAKIAAEMRQPSTGQNAVMQLNMGEGKSSVIVPMVAASLADESLVRVIVAKPQAKQMFDILVNKLGGLVDRPIYHAPFSRAVKPGPAEAKAVHEIFEDCMRQGGILLVKPEDILSFKLVGIERACSGDKQTSQLLLRSQELLQKSSRDIVDESDENFSPKFELVYTMGTQRPVDHSPVRWSCLQQVLGIFRDCISLILKQHPHSIETCQAVKGSFPRTRILRSDAMEAMVIQIADQILEMGLIGFPVARKSKTFKSAVHTYITKQELNQREVDEVEQHEGWTEAERNTLLLLRGLLAGGVLAFVFSTKRWKVDYGLALERVPATKLAVPYRAKDNPSPRSEFSHPDVVILLTLLSYYYRGLDNDELSLAFAHLQRSDQASAAYQEWVQDANGLPDTSLQLDGVNLDDHVQSHLIFPKEMKEFPHKLSASGWDIAEVKQHVTTGFSGTNDSRIVLPLSMEQLDLDEQRHTNALVLEHLLQPENQVTPMPTHRKEGERDADRLLSMVVNMERKIRVILDVGAQILEFSNREVAEKWLKLLPNDGRTEGVVFFDENDNLCAIDRNGRVDYLQASRFAARLDVCLIFLDEAHTRGTDLKLPHDYRAAVTLGANLTKDRLVQACMRMRELGRGQSVVFCVPEEILHKICAFSSKLTGSQIDVSDVLGWSISETWQQALWTSYRDSGGKTLTEDMADCFMEAEAQTLREKYGAEPCRNHAVQDAECASEVPDEIDRMSREFETGNEQAALQQEAERELSTEAEEEKEVEKPTPAKALEHKLHDHVLAFLETGEVWLDSPAYMPAFESLSHTSAALRQGFGAPDCKSLFVTADFANTVALRGKSSLMDSFQRPVQWILTRQQRVSNHNEVDFMMIISPYEAQELMAKITSSKHVSLHIYAPRSNLGFQPLDSLDLFTMPQRTGLQVPLPLITRLNLFSGQLYFKTWCEYTEACDFLGIPWGAINDDEECVLGADIAIQGEAQKANSGASFRDSLAVWMRKIRRNCTDIDRTHVGIILGNRMLKPNHFADS
ncbi:hypothetical protein QQS21_003139 [Conoideocrella luteorostrata]|uniref:ubiquitinyl hydrolase 1 n=1 Tax=Conoideocrella luteorostrata TaxID=1105319 RepID=A0AAJ0CTT5_9HYPO|nr:hypothetical protein QQS21_003139 [Conoideocrella luteorostrata]